MKTSAIGIVQPDGRILVATATSDDDVASTLAHDYATPLRATMLISLGRIERLGRTPADCRVKPDAPEAVLMDLATFERMALGDTSAFHLFERGRWTSWADEPIANHAFQIDGD